MPPNHLRNFGNILRYENLVMLSTSELEDELATVGLPSENAGIYADDRIRQTGHRIERAGWITNFVSESYGLPPYSYDVHLLDDAVDNEAALAQGRPEALRRHWCLMLGSVVAAHSIQSPAKKRSSLFWRYEPFELEDARFSLLGEQSSEGPMSAEQMRRLIAAISSPVLYKFASARLEQPIGELKAANVTFGYPAVAEFTRSTRVHPGAMDGYGDRLISTTNVSSRSFTPDIPHNIQQVVDQLVAASQQEVREIVAREGETMFLTGDYERHLQADLNGALAPLYNQI